MSDKNKQQELKAILKKYINNEASDEEREAVNSWYKNVGSANDEVPALNNPALKDKLSSDIKIHLREEILGKKKYWSISSPGKYAAACLLLITLGLWGYSYVTHPKKSGKKDIVILSGKGAQKKLTLPDGSEIMLNVGSKLVISKDFGEEYREVTLVGEAFFNVAKDHIKPFIIHSGMLKTRVVGTSFNINAYPDLEKIKIAVLTGKVKVSGTIAGRNKILAMGITKGETLSFYKSTQVSDLKKEDTDLITSWRLNKLYIDNATVQDIARQLERYYQIKVVYAGTADAKDRYSIRFNNESMNGVLQILSLLTKKKFVYHANQITIK